MVKMTVIGCSCVMTASVTLPGGLHHITGIHKAQAHASVDGSSDVAKIDLNLLELHRSLVVLYGAFVLHNQLLLIVQNLLGDGVAGPRVLVARQIHLRFGEQILVAFERPLRLQKLSAVGTRIDVDQRIALVDALALRVVHGIDQAVDLAGNRIGVDRGDGADGVEVDADTTLLRRRARNKLSPGAGRAEAAAFSASSWWRNTSTEIKH